MSSPEENPISRIALIREKRAALVSARSEKEAELSAILDAPITGADALAFALAEVDRAAARFAAGPAPRELCAAVAFPRRAEAPGYMGKSSGHVPGLPLKSAPVTFRDVETHEHAGTAASNSFGTSINGTMVFSYLGDTFRHGTSEDALCFFIGDAIKAKLPALFAAHYPSAAEARGEMRADAFLSVAERRDVAQAQREEIDAISVKIEALDVELVGIRAAIDAALNPQLPASPKTPANTEQRPDDAHALWRRDLKLWTETVSARKGGDRDVDIAARFGVPVEYLERFYRMPGPPVEPPRARQAAE